MADEQARALNLALGSVGGRQPSWLTYPEPRPAHPPPGSTPKRRGRPPKEPPANSPPLLPPNPRGRPRKRPLSPRLTSGNEQPHKQVNTSSAVVIPPIDNNHTTAPSMAAVPPAQNPPMASEAASAAFPSPSPSEEARPAMRPLQNGHQNNQSAATELINQGSRPQSAQGPSMRTDRPGWYTKEDCLRVLQSYSMHLSNDPKLRDMLRLRVLKDAIEAEDWSYLIMHQFYCMLALSKEYLPQGIYSHQNRQVTINLMAEILDDNRHLSPNALSFFASFPYHVSILAGKYPTEFNHHVQMFSQFMDRSYLYETIKTKALLDECPPLVRDLRDGLGIHSPKFKILLLTSFLRQIWFWLPEHQQGSTIEERATAIFSHYARLPQHSRTAVDRDTEYAAWKARIQGIAHDYLPGSQSSRGQTEMPSAQNEELYALPSTSTASPSTTNPHISAASRRALAQGQYAPRLGSFQPSPATSPYAQQQQQFQHQFQLQPPHPGHFPGGHGPPAQMMPFQQHQHILPSQLAAHHLHPSAMPQPSGPARTESQNLAMPPQPSQNLPHQDQRLQAHPGMPRRIPTQQQSRPSRPLLPPRPYHLPIQRDPDPTRFSLHQAGFQSPILKARSDDSRLYHYWKDYIEPPRRLSEGGKGVERWTFSLTKEMMQSMPLIDNSVGGIDRGVVSDGQQTARVRCVKLAGPNIPNDSTWATAETSWPPYSYFRLNDSSLQQRKKIYHGKDLPIDVTRLLIEGDNTLEIGMLCPPTDTSYQNYVVAIELVRVASHKSIKEDCTTNKRLPMDLVKRDIANKLSASGDDDEVLIVDSSVAINLFDPFSGAVMCETPVRGRTCLHHECFDLETFLGTRNRRGDISVTDHWRCPICRADARPSELVVDGFLQEVRAHLTRQNMQDTRTIIVSQDGSWKPKSQPARAASGSSDEGTTAQNVPRQPVQVEVIDLSD